MYAYARGWGWIAEEHEMRDAPALSRPLSSSEPLRDLLHACTRGNFDPRDLLGTFRRADDGADAAEILTSLPSSTTPVSPTRAGESTKEPAADMRRLSGEVAGGEPVA